MKTAVKVKIIGYKKKFPGPMEVYWEVWLIGASGRRLMADRLTLNRNYYARWYESDTFAGVGFGTIAHAKQWFTDNMESMYPEFVNAEREELL